MSNRELMYFGILGCLFAGLTHSINNYTRLRGEKAAQRRQLQDWENEGGAITSVVRQPDADAASSPQSTR